MAILLPDLTSLNYNEVIYFFVEHYQIAIINPLILIFSERFYTPDLFSIRHSIIAHCFFGWYSRIFLGTLSNLTWANVNYNLCPCKSNNSFLLFLFNCNYR